MATDDQIRANRENSQYSTGPDDTSQTRLNGLKHGKYYRGGKVLPNENLNEFIAMGEQIFEEMRPVGFVEYRLCMLMNERQWEMDRYSRLKVDVQYSADYRDTMYKELEKLEGFQERAERSFDRAMRRLENRQNYRRKHFPDLEAQAGTLENKVRFFLATFNGAHWEYRESQGEMAEVNLQDKAIRYLHQQELKAKGYSNIWNHYLQWADQQAGSWDFDNGDPPPQLSPTPEAGTAGTGNPDAEKQSEPGIAFVAGPIPPTAPVTDSNPPEEDTSSTGNGAATGNPGESATPPQKQGEAAPPEEPEWKRLRNWFPTPRLVHEPKPPANPSG